MKLMSCFYGFLKRNMAETSLFPWCCTCRDECDLRGPRCLSSVFVKVRPMLRDSLLLLSHLHIIRIHIMGTHWNPAEKHPYVSIIFGCIPCLWMLWNAKEALALRCRFNEALNQPSISLMSVPVSICLFSEGSYSKSNGPSYLCNGSTERTPSLGNKLCNLKWM